MKNCQPVRGERQVKFTVNHCRTESSQNSTLFSSVSLAPCFEIGHRQSRLVDVLDLGMNLGWEEREKEKRDGTEIEEGVSEMTKYGVLVLQVTT